MHPICSINSCAGKQDRLVSCLANLNSQNTLSWSSQQKVTHKKTINKAVHYGNKSINKLYFFVPRIMAENKANVQEDTSEDVDKIASTHQLLGDSSEKLKNENIQRGIVAMWERILIWILREDEIDPGSSFDRHMMSCLSIFKSFLSYSFYFFVFLIMYFCLFLVIFVYIILILHYTGIL